MQLWSPTTRVAVAVSGGSDSVALLFLVRELAAAGDLVLAGLAHLNHHIRGQEAEDDAAFCRALGSRLNVPVVVGEADVPALATRDGVSIEVAGRQARQRFFAEALTSLDASRVALAHTRDDQAETVLLRLVRGAGSAGLGGMSPRRDRLIRPVLGLSRDELRGYLVAIGESWREDATNADRANPRNRIRHEVLPLLREHFNPRVDAALARTADILRSDGLLLDSLAADAAARILTPVEGAVAVDAAGLSGLAEALARRVALVALETANPGRSYGLEEAAAVCGAAAGGGLRDLPGVCMKRSGAAVVLQKRETAGPEGTGFELQLEVPGAVQAPWNGWRLTAEGPMPPEAAGVLDRSRVAVDAGLLTPGLLVRQRRPGDRLTPQGAPGRKKVQDVLVDRKVPRDERDRVPIVTDAMGQIVWVAGQALAEPFRPGPRTSAVVILTLRRM